MRRVYSVTDPPFNISNGTRTFAFQDRTDIVQHKGEWDDVDPHKFRAAFDAWASEWSRLLRAGGSGYVFCADRHLSHLGDALERAGLTWRSTITWIKTNPPTQVTQNHWKSACEYILFFTNGDDYCRNWQGENEMRNWMQHPICAGKERLLDA